MLQHFILKTKTKYIYIYKTKTNGKYDIPKKNILVLPYQLEPEGN